MNCIRIAGLAPVAGLFLMVMVPLSANAGPTSAAPVPVPVVSAMPTTAVLAESVSWHGFVKYWTGFVNNADRVILVVALVAAAALFIITRGKWMR